MAQIRDALCVRQTVRALEDPREGSCWNEGAEEGTRTRMQALGLDTLTEKKCKNGCGCR